MDSLKFNPNESIKTKEKIELSPIEKLSKKRDDKIKKFRENNIDDITTIGNIDFDELTEDQKQKYEKFILSLSTDVRIPKEFEFLTKIRNERKQLNIQNVRSDDEK